MNDKKEYSSDDILDYIYCPEYYKIKNIVGGNKDSNCKSICNSVKNYIFIRELDNKKTTFKDIQNKYEELAKKNNIDNKTMLKYFGYITSFWNFIVSNEIFLVDCCIDTSIGIKNGCIFKSRIDTIIRYKDQNGKNALLFTPFSRRNIKEDMLRKDNAISFQVMLYNEIYGEIPDIYILDTKYSKLIKTFRNMHDLEESKKEICNITKCMMDEVYYKRQTNFCETCDLRKYCLSI